MSKPAQPSAAPRRKSGWLNLVVDYAPLVVFFLVYRHFAPTDHSLGMQEVAAVIFGTAAFMAASVAALIFSKLHIGHISPMLWLTTAMIVGFGAITIYTQDAEWIRHKPTAVYLLFAVILFGGLWRGKALLKVLLEAAFEGLDDRGWWLLSRNWAIFFLFLAVLNEALNIKFDGHFYFALDGDRHFYWTTPQWIAAKLWLFMPLSFLFTFVHLPMLMRHGLGREEEPEVITHPPHD